MALGGEIPGSDSQHGISFLPRDGWWENKDFRGDVTFFRSLFIDSRVLAPDVCFFPTRFTVASRRGRVRETTPVYPLNRSEQEVALPRMRWARTCSLVMTYSKQFRLDGRVRVGWWNVG